jgi:protein-S-isoprenylcysteine O-methyltransferase Ste14
MPSTAAAARTQSRRDKQRAQPAVAAQNEPFVCLQRPATGYAGAATMIALYTGYLTFQDQVPGGGPQWSTLLFGLFRDVARDYVDVFLCILGCFSIMVLWEKAAFAFRWFGLALVLAVAALVANSHAGGVTVGGAFFTVPEQWMGALLAVLWAFIAIDFAMRVAKGKLKPVENRREVSWEQAATSGFSRWAALAALFGLAVVIYQTYRVYAGTPQKPEDYYTNWRITSACLLTGFLVLGLPYCILTVKYRSNFTEDRKDPGLIAFMLGRRVWTEGPSAFLVLKKRRVRVVFLDLLVKFFWMPLMVTFVFGECGDFHNGLTGAAKVFGPAGFADGLAQLWTAFWGHSNEVFLTDSYHAIYHLMFVIDCTIGLLGYATSSRWLGNKSKSAEFTALGWWCALACYPPFNNVTGTLLPYDVSPTGHGYWFFNLIWVHHAMMLLTLCLFFIYVWATVVFGLRFSNLTHRGILNTGPYRWIRHPAYATKNLAWWAENLQMLGSPWQFVCLAGLNAVYITRALTEERHLMHFEDYRKYAAEVKWRFIPGVV